MHELVFGIHVQCADPLGVNSQTIIMNRIGQKNRQTYEKISYILKEIQEIRQVPNRMRAMSANTTRKGT